jgi:hypothetical protein
LITALHAIQMVAIEAAVQVAGALMLAVEGAERV